MNLEMWKISKRVRAGNFLNISLIFLALSLIFLFKNNYPVINTVKVSWLVFFIPFLFFLSAFLIRKVKKIRTTNILVFLMIIALVFVVKIPVLLQIEGVYHSDDAVIGLMSKHMVEGKPMPLFFYGQRYLGSSYMLINTLFFLLLGKSILTLTITALFLFSLFIYIQYITFSEFFDPLIGYLSIGFYVTAGGILMKNIFSIGGNFPLVYILLALILYFSLKIAVKNELNWVFVLGFLVGFGFWTHQITFIFSLVSVLLIVMKKNLKAIVSFSVSFFMGILPYFLHEVFNSFINLRFTFFGGTQASEVTSFHARGANLIKGLLNIFPWRMPIILVIIIYGLFIYFISRCVFLLYKNRKISAELVISLAFISFVFIYLFSPFSKNYIQRYFMPVYVLLPIPLFLAFKSSSKKISFKKKIFLLPGVAFLSFLVVFGVIDHNYFGKAAKKKKGFRQALINNLKETGMQNWYTRNYNNTYILSFLSLEDLKITNGTIERYFPYLLDYYQSPVRNIYLIRKKGGYLKKILDSYGIGYQLKKVGPMWLFSDIRWHLNTWNLKAKILKKIPRINIEHKFDDLITITVDGIQLTDEAMDRLRLNIRVKHPQYPYSITKKISKINGLCKLDLKLPEYLSGRNVICEVFPDVDGTAIAGAKVYKNLDIRSKYFDRDSKFLSGFGPVTDLISGYYRPRNQRLMDDICVKAKQTRIMEKESVILLRNTDNIDQVVLKVYALIDFRKHMWWFPDFSQELYVSLYPNGDFKKYRIVFGENKIIFPVKKPVESPYIKIRLKTKYVVPFVFDEIGRYETGVALGSIDITKR